MSRETNPKSLLIIMAFLLAILSTAAVGRIIYVDDDANGLNDGTSWQNAYNYLQDALADANSSTKSVEICVAQGIYIPDRSSAEPNGTGDREAAFQLINGVTLKGGYAGFGQPDPNARNIDLYETILSGDLNGNDGLNFVNNSENSYHVVVSDEAGGIDMLDGFTITGGNANGSGWYRFGGGMYCDSDAKITNCTLQGNWADNGGGMHCGPTWCCVTEPMLINCRFEGNAARYGGGLCIGDSDPIIVNCMITGNRARKEGGGLMFDCDNFTTVNNCLISGNWAGEDGGGMYCIFTFSFTVTNCTVSENCAGGHGGGMFDGYDTYPALTNSIFWGNRDSESVSSAAQIYVDRGRLPTVNHCCIQGGWKGEGNIDADPCFASPGYRDPNGTPQDPNDDFWVDGDYHLKSQAGHWDANEGRWTKDEVTSLCIDAGDPDSPIGLEPFPNGGIINMGAYGGTAEASKSYFGEPVCETIVAGDINGDCKVDFKDFALMALHWLRDENQ